MIVNQRLENRLANLGAKRQEALRLNRRETEVRHLQEFRPNPVQHLRCDTIVSGYQQNPRACRAVLTPRSSAPEPNVARKAQRQDSADHLSGKFEADAV